MTSTWRPIERRRLLGSDLLTVAAIAFAAGLVTWWLAGDLGEVGGDHSWRFRFGDEHPRLLAATGSALAVLAVVVVRRTWWPRAGLRGLRPVGFAAVAGVVVGYSARVMTAATAGANIGGGMVLLVAPFVVVALLAQAVSRVPRR